MKDQVIKILTDIRPEFEFTDDVNFVEQGMLDSFDIVTIVDTVETEMGVNISGLDILPENFASVEAIINLIEKNRA